MQQIADWLRKLGMSEYAERFAENHIEIDILPESTDHDLEGLGLSLGHRRRILRALRELGTPAPAAPQAAAAGACRHGKARRPPTVDQERLDARFIGNQHGPFQTIAHARERPIEGVEESHTKAKVGRPFSEVLHIRCDVSSRGKLQWTSCWRSRLRRRGCKKYVFCLPVPFIPATQSRGCSEGMERLD
jgi:SAM domain (Sterile alpha motif)